MPKSWRSRPQEERLGVHAVTEGKTKVAAAEMRRPATACKIQNTGEPMMPSTKKRAVASICRQ